MTFSGAVRLVELDDFISPANDCVIPLNEEPKPDLLKATGKPDAKKIASVALSDCLACSGCVTSAETVLLEQQSGDELCKRSKSWSPACPLSSLTPEQAHMNDFGTALVMTISSPSRTSLARYYGLPSAHSVVPFLAPTLKKVFGVDAVLNSCVAEEIVLAETMEEAETRLARGEGPLLTSHCPGFTVFAEKTLPKDLLPLLSKVRAAEQVQGVWLKTWLQTALRRRRRTGTSYAAAVGGGETVYHILISPCFDRKLEVLRENYKLPTGEQAVDLVLATSELVKLLNTYAHDSSQGKAPETEEASRPHGFVASLFGMIKGNGKWPVNHIPSEKTASTTRSDSPNNLTNICSVSPVLSAILPRSLDWTLLIPPAMKNGGWTHTDRFSESGGYAQAYVQKKGAGEREWVPQKNNDMHLHPSSGAVRAYGYRNVQNVARLLKQHLTPEKGVVPSAAPRAWKVVEVMACPGGCINGGGQVEPELPKEVSTEEDTRRSAFGLLFENREGLPWAKRARAFVDHMRKGTQMVEKRKPKGALAGERRKLLSDIHHSSVQETPVDSRVLAVAEVRKALGDAQNWRAAEWRSLADRKDVKQQQQTALNPAALKW